MTRERRQCMGALGGKKRNAVTCYRIPFFMKLQTQILLYDTLKCISVYEPNTR